MTLKANRDPVLTPWADRSQSTGWWCDCGADIPFDEDYCDKCKAMKKHEEILKPYAFEEPTYGSTSPRELITQSDALNAMQQAVDQALAWVPVDRNNLPDHDVLCYDDTFAAWGSIIELGSLNPLICVSNGETVLDNVTHYFDPANFKTPQP